MKFLYALLLSIGAGFGVVSMAPAKVPTMYDAPYHDPTGHATSSYTVTATITTGPYYETHFDVPVVKFNDSLGTLDSVVVDITSQAKALTDWENTYIGPATLYIGNQTGCASCDAVAGGIYVFTPDDSATLVYLLGIIGPANQTRAAYDGTTDYAGPSGGRININNFASPEVFNDAREWTLHSIVALFAGGDGTSTVTLRGQRWMQGFDDYCSESGHDETQTLTAGGAVTFHYNFH